MAKSFQGEAIQPPVPFNSALTSIKPSCRILQNGGVILLQLSCHILENVNERVCKIKFMGCQWRIRTRRAITYLLSSWSLWYVKQKSMQLNAGISIVLHFTVDVGHCLCFFFSSFPLLVIITHLVRSHWRQKKQLLEYFLFIFARFLLRVAEILYYSCRCLTLNAYISPPTQHTMYDLDLIPLYICMCIYWW